jgi:hypothetical protein
VHRIPQVNTKRILIGFGPPAIAWLEYESRRLGISVNELVRRCVDVERAKTNHLFMAPVSEKDSVDRPGKVPFRYLKKEGK